MRPTEELIREAIEAAGGFRPAARILRERGYDISESNIRRMNKRWAEVDSPFEVELPGGRLAEQIDVDALIARRIQQYRQKREIYDREKLIQVRVKKDGPIGLAFAGDWHLDDDGTDLEQVLDHVSLLDGSVEALYAGNLGDSWNNWAGRLARLYAEQSTSSAESLALVEEILTRVNWLFYINGNHDVWQQGADILRAVLSGHVAVQKSNRARLALRLPSGRNVKISAAHSFPGKSMWTEAYGALKAAQLDGDHHDIYVAGHIHTSGYSHGTRPNSDRVWHAVQVASYKKIDRYAEELNLPEKDIYTCPVALIDPYAKSEINFVRFEFDPHEGAERLKWMRSRWEAGKSSS